MTAAGGTARRRSGIALPEAIALAAVTVLPLFAGGRGRLNADTKQYLYLDPVDLLDRARTVWDSRVGGGAVTHQAIGYLWPMGPFYALTDWVGLPPWAAQRLWVGGLQLVAALGALALFRHLLPRTWLHVPAAAAYGLSPFVLGHLTSQSGLLVPFAGLGWLVLLMAKAIEAPRSWRWPAAFALVVTTCGSLNGSSVFFVVLAATLWVPFACRGTGATGRRDGLRVLLRAGALTLVTQLWWLVAYAVGGAYNLPILEITETVRTTNATPSATEVLRGLGYWFFYGGDTEGPWLGRLSTPYQTSGLLLVVSFALPLLALASGAVLRWRHRGYFVALVGLGTVISVGAFPIADPSPAGAAFERLSRSSDLVLSLRNTQRAGALVALGLAGLLAAGLTTLGRERPRLSPLAGGLAALLVAGTLPAQWRTGMVAERFDRGDLPTAWTEAAAHLDRGEGRVLELPGSDFATYRWGAALDPVSVGLTDRPFVARELVPLGGDAGADLLEALDRSLQEGWFEPASLAPVARLLGAADVLIRNDLAYERYRTVRPRVLWPLLQRPEVGLGPPVTFGGSYDNRAGPGRPMVDEVELGLDPLPEPPPQLAVRAVPDGDRPALSARPVGGGTVVDGDGEGIVSAAAAGLIDGRGLLLLGADLVAGDDLDRATDHDTRYVLTDSNRKRAKRWYSLRENAGATEPADGTVVLDDPSDARLEVAGTTPPGSQTVVEWRGVDRIWASAYGGLGSLVPEERPANAFDGDPTTAWRSELGADGERRRIGVDLDRSVDADHLRLVAPQGRLGTVTLARVRVTLDGERTFDVRLSPEEGSRAEGVEVALDGEPFRTVEVEIVETVPHQGLGGFAEVVIPGVKVEEVVVLPTALADLLGARVGEVPLAVVLTRLRANPAEPLRDDPEPSLLRAFTLPAAVEVTITGAARLDPNADEDRLDALLGAGPDVWPVSARSTGRLAGDLDARASSTLDGDPTTAWQTPFSEVAGQGLDIDTDRPVRLDRLTLDVVHDGRHSLPTQVRLSVDGGEPVTLDLPDLGPPEADGVTAVSLPLPEAFSGTRWHLELSDVAIRSTTDWSTLLPFTLPAGIAEIHLPGVPRRPDPSAIDTGCRDDILEVGGTAVPVRITGRAADAELGLPLDLVRCGEGLRLRAGTTEVRTAPGRATALDLDRLVLESSTWSDPVEPGPAPVVTVDGERPGDVSGTVETDGSPFWLVLDESMNDGWELSVDGATGSGPRPIDAYAAGWLVTPERAGRLAVHARWTPQRAVDLALVVSAVGVLVCLVLALRRRTTTVAFPRDRPEVPHQPPSPSWRLLAVGTAAAALLVAPVAAVPAAAVMVAARRWPWAGRAVPVALVAAAAAAVAVLQVAHRYPADFPWPTRFPWTHQVALLGLVVMTTLALSADGDQRRR